GNADQVAMQIGRYTLTKEQHAEICKRELNILWHDYFRPEHLEKYPDLHTKFWMADKLASRNKQSIDEGAANELLNAVNEIAEIFWATKNVATRRGPSNQTAGGEFVYPAGLRLLPWTSLRHVCSAPQSLGRTIGSRCR